MNNTFNLKRFVWYFKKHTIENGRTYLLSLAVAAGIIFLGLALPAFIGAGVLSENYQYGMYIFLLWLGGSIFTSTIFANLGDKKKAILPLTLPVSALERFVVAWLYTFPIFLVIANCCFFAIDSLVISISHPTTGPNVMINLFKTITPGLSALILFAMFQMLCFWGAIYFNRLHFIKTAFVFFIAFFGSIFLNKAMLWLISGGVLSSYNFFFDNQVFVNGKYYSLVISDNIYTISWIFFTLALIIMWMSSYYKLKEKQV